MRPLSIHIFFAVGLTLSILFCAMSKRIPKPQRLMMVTIVPLVWGQCFEVNPGSHPFIFATNLLPFIGWLNFRAWTLIYQPFSASIASNLLRDSTYANNFVSKRHVSIASKLTLISFAWVSFMFITSWLYLYGTTLRDLLLAIAGFFGVMVTVSFSIKRCVKKILGAQIEVWNEAIS